jgi:phage tail sheath protein FI
MAAQYKTPGVYVVEVDGFSSSVVEVATAIPAFIGFTEYAKNGNQDLTNVPMPITSMVEFQKYFADPTSLLNGAPKPQFNYVTKSNAMPPYATDPSGPRFNLYYSMQMFFNNGGGSCYIVSIGTYKNVIANGSTIDPTLFINALQALTKFAQPTMLVMPDATMLSVDDWKTVSQMSLTHCNTMQSRIAIFDVVNGYLPADGTTTDPISGADGMSGFYKVAGLGEEFDKYGVAYYPWLNTDIVNSSNIDFSWLSTGTLGTLQGDLITESTSIFPPATAGGPPNAKLAPYQAIINALAVPQPSSATYAQDVITQKSNHQTLLSLSPTYQQTMTDISTSVNLLPPSGAMAGVYTRNDNTFGVYQSPANTTIISANSPAVNINDFDQQNLNVPLNGLAVNAIRAFPNYGLLVWGARTMAGNSDDWRYVSVRRTMIMLEQSIKAAMQAYVFKSNDALTWTAVNSTITNFLNSQWKAGALVGAKASDAFNVSVGLGVTMTGEDILNGLMNVSIGVAVVRPAEFIILTFQQQMQTS